MIEPIANAFLVENVAARELKEARARRWKGVQTRSESRAHLYALFNVFSADCAHARVEFLARRSNADVMNLKALTEQADYSINDCTNDEHLENETPLQAGNQTKNLFCTHLDDEVRRRHPVVVYIRAPLERRHARAVQRHDVLEHFDRLLEMQRSKTRPKAELKMFEFKFEKCHFFAYEYVDNKCAVENDCVCHADNKKRVQEVL